MTRWYRQRNERAWERPVVAPKLRKSAAILLGARARGPARGGGLSWLGRYIERQGINELDITARRAIGLAEARLVMVTEALDGLAARGVRSCAGADLEAMHETSFRVVPIKELSVVEPAGDTRCTNLAIPLGERRVIGTIENPRSDITIEIVRLGDVADGLVRIRRDSGRRSRARRADAHRHHAAAHLVERQAACDRPEAAPVAALVA